MSHSTPPGGTSWRTLAGPGAVFLGAAVLTASVAVAGAGAAGPGPRIPVAADATTTAIARGARLLDPCSVTADRGRVVDATLVERTRVRVVDPVGAGRVTWQAGRVLAVATVPGQCPESIVDADIDQITVDRLTGAPVPDGSAELEQLPAGSAGPPERARVDRRGLQYRFGPGVDPTRDYHYFDTATRADYPARFAGATQIGGVPVFRYVVDLPERRVIRPAAGFDRPAEGRLVRPAAWFPGYRGDDPTAPVTAQLYQSGHRTLFVEPRSGIVVKTDFRRDQYLRAGQYRLDYASGRFVSDDHSVAAQLAAARAINDAHRLRVRVVPAITGVTGVIVLASGGWLIARRRRFRPRPAGSADPTGPAAGGSRS
ncbi:DUF3068 domain-containing protein [Gordonia sp. X0973]|uniref:porin PorA family protein n=1 Tax=Gordonia sp. X0973 TaxID=2742602 RepID=UPI0013EAF9E8|nr:porin PorA family protein [Gordonia sp. X0973]QKT06058.1 DUF3068 domain-containing protein [Gordonia sp. X0973]